MRPARLLSRRVCFADKYRPALSQDRRGDFADLRPNSSIRPLSNIVGRVAGASQVMASTRYGAGIVWRNASTEVYGQVEPGCLRCDFLAERSRRRRRWHTAVDRKVVQLAVPLPELDLRLDGLALVLFLH